MINRLRRPLRVAATRRRRVVATRRRAVVTTRRRSRVVATHRRLPRRVVTTRRHRRRATHRRPRALLVATLRPSTRAIRHRAHLVAIRRAGPGFPGAQAFNVGEAFSWAWNKFTKNAVALIVPALVYGIIVGILVGAVYGLAFALAPTTDLRVLRQQLQLRSELRLRKHPCAHRRLHHPDGGRGGDPIRLSGWTFGYRERAAGDDRVVLQAAQRRQCDHCDPDHRRRGRNLLVLLHRSDRGGRSSRCSPP